MQADYSLLLARKKVQCYSQRSESIARQAGLLECRDCECFLRLGIEAYKFLRQTEDVLRQADRENLDVPDDFLVELSDLYRAWLRPYAHAEERARQLQKQGFSVGNLKQFREACEYVENRASAHEGMHQSWQGPLLDDAFADEFWLEARMH